MRLFRAVFICFCLASALSAWATAIDSVSAARQSPPDSIGSVTLSEVVVSDNPALRRLSSPQLGAERLELARLAMTPSFGGEADIIKSLSLLPGVHSEGEGGGGFEVRGGTSDRNLILLDGITLYNPAHVMGIFSTFNDDAISRATLFKGPLPASFGGASSAALDAALSPGEMDRYQGSASIGILLAKLSASGPIVRDRLSFAIAARRSYIDAFLQMVPKYRKTVMNFYDVTAKLRIIPRPSDYIDVTFFSARDNMAIHDVMGMYWGNLGASANWFSRASSGLSFLTTVALDHYDPRMDMTMMKSDQLVREFIHTYSVNEKATLVLSPRHSLEFGIRSELFRVKSAEMMVNETRQIEMRSGWANALWISYSGRPLQRLTIDAGLRLSTFSSLSGDSFHRFEAIDEPSPVFSSRTWFTPEPRISVGYFFSDIQSVRAGASVTSQNLHTLRTSTTSFPFDRYAIASGVVRPERCYQYTVGYVGGVSGGDYDWSADIYYKDMHDIYEFRDGYGMFSGVNLESLIARGRGRSYGIELMARKNTGRLTGWISYTLSHTLSRVPGINGDKWFDANNDRRNDFSAVAIFALNDRWNLSASWIYTSGKPLTAPDVKYDLSGTTCYYYSRRNGYRTPPTHRLDLSATYTRRGSRFTRQWAFGLYNAYCRYNPFVIYFQDDPSSPSGTRAVQQSLFGVIPSVSFTLSF